MITAGRDKKNQNKFAFQIWIDGVCFQETGGFDCHMERDKFAETAHRNHLFPAALTSESVKSEAELLEELDELAFELFEFQ